MPYRSSSTATTPYDHLPGFGPIRTGILRALRVIDIWYWRKKMHETQQIGNQVCVVYRVAFDDDMVSTLQPRPKLVGRPAVHRKPVKWAEGHAERPLKGPA